MNARQFHEHYGINVVRKIVDKLGTSFHYWKGIKGGYTPISHARALELAQLSTEVIGENDEPMTVLELLKLDQHPARIIGTVRSEK